MRRLDLKTGFSCNNRCVFCVQGDKRDEHPDKGFDELCRILEEGRATSDSVVLTGGEVTLRKDLVELVAHARALGYQTIQVQTNGRMLAVPELARRLIEAGANEISPAVHGPDDATHDTLTRSPRSFRQTVKGIRNAKALGARVVVNSVITRANYTRLPEMAWLFVRLGVDQFQLAFVHALGSAEQNFEAVVPRFSEIRPFVHEALRIGLENGVRCMTEAIPLCILGPYAQYAAEWIIPDTTIVDATWTIPDYREYRLEAGKLKGEPCVGCRANRACEGPWREYPERFGWSEMRRL